MYRDIIFSGERYILVCGSIKISYLGEMGLELVLGIHVLANAVSEGIVDRVPLVDHGGGTLVEQRLNLVPHVPGSSPLAL